MEAWRFGFDRSQFPAACKFNPTDADIVAHYLLPRALGGVPNPPPHAHAVVDADPCSCPPWELMRRAGHAASDHAFFFPPPRPPGNKRAARRAVSPAAEDGGIGGAGVGGKWAKQKSTDHSVVIVRGGGGGEMVVKYKLCNLSYYHGDEPCTSGWVMNEYQITDPPWLSGTVLARVSVTDKGKQRLKDAAAAAAAAAAGGDGDGQQLVGVPGPDEPGPSNYGDDGNATGLSSGGGEESDEGVVCLGDGDGSVMGEMAAYFVDDDGDGYLNDGFGYYQDGGGGGGYGLTVGDNQR